MGKYLSVLIGMAAIAIGLMGLRAAWPLVWAACKVVVPIVLVFGGIVAVLVGVGEISDSMQNRSTKS